MHVVGGGADQRGDPGRRRGGVRSTQSAVFHDEIRPVPHSSATTCCIRGRPSGAARRASCRRGRRRPSGRANRSRRDAQRARLVEGDRVVAVRGVGLTPRTLGRGQPSSRSRSPARTSSAWKELVGSCRRPGAGRTSAGRRCSPTRTKPSRKRTFCLSMTSVGEVPAGQVELRRPPRGARLGADLGGQVALLAAGHRAADVGQEAARGPGRAEHAVGLREPEPRRAATPRGSGRCGSAGPGRAGLGEVGPVAGGRGRVARAGGAAGCRPRAGRCGRPGGRSATARMPALVAGRRRGYGAVGRLLAHAGPATPLRAHSIATESASDWVICRPAAGAARRWCRPWRWSPCRCGRPRR